MFLGALAAATLVPRAAKAQGRSKVHKPAERRTDPFRPTDRVSRSRVLRVGDECRSPRSTDDDGRHSRRDDACAAARVHGYLEYQLNYQWIDDSAVEAQDRDEVPAHVADVGSALLAPTRGRYSSSCSKSTIYRSTFSQRPAVSAHGRVLVGPLQPGLGQSPIFCSLPTIAT